MASHLPEFLIGVIAGSRTVIAPAAVSWAARLDRLPLRGTPLGFLAHPVSPIVFSVLAAGEMITDLLPGTPSRTVPVQSGGRLASGGFCGAAIGVARGGWFSGLVAGVAGAAVGTLLGAGARSLLATAIGRDFPAALLEDAAAVAGAALVAARAA